MGKVKVLLHSIWYPLAISRYYEIALKNHPNVELKTAGVYTGSWIPWQRGMTVDEKYALPPDIPLPFKPNIGKVPYEVVKTKLGDWQPDLVLTVDAGVNWTHRPNEKNVATVGTDAHALDYTHARKVSDKFFNMHPRYSEANDIKLHYVFCSATHYKMLDVEKDTDTVLIGMPYEHRVQWVNILRQKGVSVLFENRPIFDEYRELNNRATIGLNWSSKGDLNARAFELMAMGLVPVIDRCQDLDALGFEEGRHYLGFSSLGEAVEKVLWAKSNPDEAKVIALSAYQKVWNEDLTYTSLVNKILKEFNLG